jgi:hypothetical protein
LEHGLEQLKAERLVEHDQEMAARRKSYGRRKSGGVLLARRKKKGEAGRGMEGNERASEGDCGCVASS